MASQFCVRVGNNIKKYRKEVGITLKELGEKIGVTEATAQKYEAGNIKKIDVEMLKLMMYTAAGFDSSNSFLLSVEATEFTIILNFPSTSHVSPILNYFCSFCSD